MDSCSLIALLSHEPDAEVVDALLSNKDNTYICHAINLMEVYYDLARITDTENAKYT